MCLKYTVCARPNVDSYYAATAAAADDDDNDGDYHYFKYYYFINFINSKPTVLNG